MAAAVRAGLLALLLAAPVAALWAARIDSIGWTEPGQVPVGIGGPICRTVTQDGNLWIGPLLLGRDRMHFGMCSDGRTVTREWGPDCQTPSSVLIGSGSWTCQLVNSGTRTAQADAVFTIFPFSIPFWQRTAHMGMAVRADGSLGSAASTFGLAHGTVIDTGGRGDGATSKFVVDRPWQLTYGYDCSSPPGATFHMELKQDQQIGSGSQAFGASSGPPGVTRRTDTIQMSQPGVYHFQVRSACSWHVTVRD